MKERVNEPSRNKDNGDWPKKKRENGDASLAHHRV